MSTTLKTPRLAFGPATLEQLRVVLERELPEQAAGLLREVGFSAGQASYDGFVDSVSGRYGIETPQALDARYLGEALSGFFREESWGTVGIETLAPGLLGFDSPDWIEATARGAATPSCHFSAGMLSDFFTRVGGYPAAVMEVECKCQGDARCRFLIGSPDVLTWLYEGLIAGTPVDHLILALKNA